MGAQAGVVNVQRRMPTRLKGFLPTSSLTPGTLVGVAWWPAAHPLSQTMGRDCGSPRGAHCSLGPPLILVSTLWMEVILPSSFLKQAGGEAAVGNGTVEPALSPLLP